MSAQRQIVVVSTADMMEDALFAQMRDATSDANVAKFNAFKGRVTRLLAERAAFEDTVERKGADGRIYTQRAEDNKDFAQLQALCESESALRMLFALNINLRSYIFPQSQKDGKSSNETSNLKSYKKAREIAECIYTGSSTLEKVCKVTVACTAIAMRSGMDVLERDFVECFLSSRLHSIRQGSADLWSAIDEVRAKHMSSGAQTQASQMIRQLVALRSAEDVRDGRSKNVRVFKEGRVFNALLKRFGQETFYAPQEEAQEEAAQA